MIESEYFGLLVGLVGIVASSITSIVGFYYVSKANRNPLRQALYEKQIDLITQLLGKQGRFRIFLTLIVEDTAHKERATEDLLLIIKEYSELKEIGAAIMPTDLWILISKHLDAMSDLSSKFDTNNDLKPDVARYVAEDTKLALLLRSFLGVDELSEESIKLFSNPKRFNKMVQTPVDKLFASTKAYNKSKTES